MASRISLNGIMAPAGQTWRTPPPSKQKRHADLPAHVQASASLLMPLRRVPLTQEAPPSVPHGEQSASG